MNSFPFEAWLRLAVTVYHLSPSEFWAMSLADWMRLTSPLSPPLSRADVTGLMQAFPDQRSETNAQ